MNHVNDGKFLGLLGFLGFLGFLAFQGSEQYQSLSVLAWLSLLSLGSLLVFVPHRGGTVKIAVDPQKKRFLGFLSFLGFLGFLGSANPQLAGVASMAIVSGLAIANQKL